MQEQIRLYENKNQWMPHIVFQPNLLMDFQYSSERNLMKNESSILDKNQFIQSRFNIEQIFKFGIEAHFFLLEYLEIYVFLSWFFLYTEKDLSTCSMFNNFSIYICFVSIFYWHPFWLLLSVWDKSYD